MTANIKYVHVYFLRICMFTHFTYVQCKRIKISWEKNSPLVSLIKHPNCTSFMHLPIIIYNKWVILIFKEMVRGINYETKKELTKSLILSKADIVPSSWILRSQDKILGHLHVNKGGGDIVRFSFNQAKRAILWSKIPET